MPIHWDTIITGLVSAALLWGVRRLSKGVTDYQSASTSWRKSVDERLAAQDANIEVVLTLQCSQTRSDLIHKAHRYLDDLGAASTEEKQAFWAEYGDYQRICDANHITNHFIDSLAEQVMNLPTRDDR